MSSILDPEHTFASLSDSVGLDIRLRKAVSRLGHARPTLVQSKCLPLALSSGRDLLVRASTGSGKTLAYCLPVLQKLLQRPTNKKGTVGAVILVPTRELCMQVYNTLKDLTYYCDEIISVAVLSAGSRQKEELERQEAALRDKPTVVGATPNALLTQIRRSNSLLDLKTSVEMLIVDEADLVLSFGYNNDLAEIVKSLPRIYQGMLMSATLSPELDSLKKIVLHSPVIVKLEQDQDNSQGSGHLKQFFVTLPKQDKNLILYVFLKLGLLKGKGLFFVNSTDAGYRLKLFFEQFHIRAAVLNAELPFRSRLNIIDQFNVGNFDYLIATDSSTDAGQASKEKDDDDDDEDEEGGDEKEKNAKRSKKKSRKQDDGYGVSRGLDFRNVSFVVNVDIPPNPRSYAHRIGRTARGGAKGVALSLVDEKSHDELELLADIQDSQPKIALDKTSSENMQAIPVETSDSNPNQQPQPVPLDFDLQEIEGFRYRVEDVARAVTRTAVRETRAAELKAEMLNSERLQSHFEDNPTDLQILAHDRVATHVSRIQEHLKHVPKYLLPRGMQVANLNRRKKKRKKSSSSGARRLDNDPLQNFDGDVDLQGVEGDEGEEEDDDFAEFMDDDDDDDDEGESPNKKRQKTEESSSSEPKIFTNARDGTGKSTAGRNAWKERHKKGKFSNKKRKSERKYKAPLGI